MKQFLLSVSLMLSAALSAQDCSDLFISEYVEGWSNNKALEIYNPTDQAIDLSEYIVIRYSNGSTSAGEAQSIQLNGTIQPYDVYVAVIDKRDDNGTGQEAPVWDSLQAKADGFYCPDYNVSNAFYFNGNDCVALAKGDVTNPGDAQLIDFFGKLGEDPDNGNCSANFGTCGWTTEFPYVAPAGVVVTTDHSLIRKNGVLKGVTNPQLISFFNALDEYDSIPPVITDQTTGNLVGNWNTLGSHECDCNSNSIDNQISLDASLKVYPNPSVDGVFSISANTKITEVQVINMVGQTILSVNDNNGLETIALESQKGVYILKMRTAEGLVSSRKIIIK